MLLLSLQHLPSAAVMAAAATAAWEITGSRVGLERLSHLRLNHCFQNRFMDIIIHTWRDFQANVWVCNGGPFTGPSLQGPGTWSCMWEVKQGLAQGVCELLFPFPNLSPSTVVVWHRQRLLDAISQTAANRQSFCGRIWPVCESSPQLLAKVCLTVCRSH